jgi:hypothetical protein
MLVLRLAYGYITGEERRQHSNASKDKKAGIEMAAIIKKENIYLLDSTRISTTISYYLERDLGRIAPYTFQPKQGDHVILADSVITPAMQVEKQFLYQDHPFSMVKMK